MAEDPWQKVKIQNKILLLKKGERKKWPPVSWALITLFSDGRVGHRKRFLPSSRKGSYFSDSESLVFSPIFFSSPFCCLFYGLCFLDDASHLGLSESSCSLPSLPRLLYSHSQ